MTDSTWRGWAAEARRHLADIDKKLKGKLDRGPPLWKEAPEFNARVDPKQIEPNVEAYLEIALRNWIPQALNKNRDVRNALEKLSRVLIDQHQDRWLADMLAAPPSASIAARQALAIAAIRQP